jgi:hypothetical protein
VFGEYLFGKLNDVNAVLHACHRVKVCSRCSSSVR